MDPEKYVTLKKYFRSQGQKTVVTENPKIPHDRWRFQILMEKGPSPMIALSEEFVADNSPAELRDKLEKWGVLEFAMKHPDQLVVVKRTGMSLEKRNP